MVALTDNYDGTSGSTGSDNYWPDDTSWSDNVTPYYHYTDSVKVPEPEPSEFDLQLLREEERQRWREHFFVSSTPRVLVQSRCGWKTLPRIFLLSPERVVSQRYGWQ